MSCPQIWNIEKEKDREKEKVDDRPAKLNEKKSNREQEREIKKQRRHFLLEEQRENFVAVMRKREMLAATKVKMSGSEKISEQEHVRQFVHKRVTRKFLEVSLCSRAKQRQCKEMNKKSVLHVQTCFFTS